MPPTTSLLQYVTQRLATFVRRNPTLIGAHPSKLGVDQTTEVYLAFNGSVTHASVIPKVNVAGRYYHAVQVRDLDGTDSFKIQGTLSEADTGWSDITGLTALVANGITQFTGVWRQFKAVKNSGTGVATKVSLMSMY